VGISTVENETDHGLLEGKGRVERHVAAMKEGALQELENQRRLAGDPVRHGERLLHQFLPRHYAIGEANGDRLFGRDRFSCKHDLLCPAQRHLADESLGAACTGKEPEIDLGQAESRIVGKDANVEREEKFGAATKRPALIAPIVGLSQVSIMRKARCTVSANSR